MLVAKGEQVIVADVCNKQNKLEVAFGLAEKQAKSEHLVLPATCPQS
jgi:hypothetical protein